MDDEPKIYPIRYVGSRFSGGKLPLAVLPDLQAFRDLVAALAKREFKRSNPDRQRVPQGFDKGISFALIGVNEGSAVPVLQLDREVTQQSLPTIADSLEGMVDVAYNEALNVISGADNDNFHYALPADAIRALSRLGSRLQEDERIEFKQQRDGATNVVILDIARRRRLLKALQKNYSVEIEDVGVLTGIDITHNSVQVQTSRFGDVKIPLDGIGLHAIAFDGNLESSVEFSISVILNERDEFQGVESVSSVDLVRPYDADVTRCITRLAQLSHLEKGWLGDAIGEQVVHLAATRALQLVFTRSWLAKLFRIYPTEDGGVSLEFDLGQWSIAAEFLPDGTVELDGGSMAGDVEEAKTFNGVSKDFFQEFDRIVERARNIQD